MYIEIILRPELFKSDKVLPESKGVLQQSQEPVEEFFKHLRYLSTQYSP